MNPIICELCNKTFQRKSHLEEHKNRKTPCIGKHGNFECEYCDRSYTSESGLRYHYENCDIYREIKRMKVPKKIKDEIIILPHQKEKNDNKKTKIIIEDEEKIIILPKTRKNNVLTVTTHDEHKKIKKLEKKLTKKDAVIKEINDTVKDLKNEIKIKDLENELKIKDLELKVAKIDNQNGHVVNNIQIENLQVNNGNVNNNILTAQYITNNCVSGTTLGPLPNYDAIMDCNINNSSKFIKDKCKGKRKTLKNKRLAFVELILNIYSNGRLIEFVGDIMISSYKNSNYKDQTIWTTDVARFTFLMRVLDPNKNPLWVKDKVGGEIKKITINPLLKYINGLIILFQKENFNPDTNIKCIEISKNITNGSMANQIIKYIAPHFSFKNRLICMDQVNK